MLDYLENAKLKEITVEMEHVPRPPVNPPKRETPKPKQPPKVTPPERKAPPPPIPRRKDK